MLKVGFLGAGRMAQALAKGLIAAGVTKGEHIVASCALDDKMSIDAFQSLGAKMTFCNPEVSQDKDVVIVSTKPDVVPSVLQETKDTITKDNLLISLAMGVSINQLEENLLEGTRVIRAMPNTPSLVLSGASVFVCGSSTTETDVNIAQRLFEAVGYCEQVPEHFLDTVTGLSGAGPAYVYIFIEALADGAVRMGLPRDLAYRLAAQTVVGAGKMVLQTKEHPGVLKDNVTSPGGTAIAGLYVLERNGFRRAVMEAIEEATNKSKEISQNTCK